MASRKLQKLIRLGSPLSSSLAEAIQQSQGAQDADTPSGSARLSGGVLIREQELDGGICVLAEALLRDTPATPGCELGLAGGVGK